jgi:polysaccharide chain length determinant protein (PEP-CTERM system associated)
MYSRPSIERLIRRSDLDLTVGSPQEMERLVFAMQEDLILEREGDDFYVIQYDHKDPKVAQKVVQNLLNLFIEQNIGQVGNKNEPALSFLTTQVEEAQRALKDIEDRISAFTQSNPDELVDISALSSRKQSLENNIRSLRTEKQFITSEIGQLERELSGTPSRISAAGNYGQSPKQARLAQLIQERDALLLRLTPQHPDVQVLNNLIAQVQASEELPEGSVGFPTVNNPMYSQLESQLSRTKLRLIAIDAQLQEEEQALRNVVDTMSKQPAIQQQYASLEEERRIAYDNLLNLQKQIQVATTSANVTSDVSLVEFRVIEPPILPLRPTGPNRLILLSAVAVGAIGAGFASAFVRIQLSGTMPTIKHLKEAFPYPVLGGVTSVDLSNSSSGVFLRIIIVCCSFFLFVLLFIILIHQFHIENWRPNLSFLQSFASLSLSDLF